jgi:hypothetical protein
MQVHHALHSNIEGIRAEDAPAHSRSFTLTFPARISLTTVPTTASHPCGPFTTLQPGRVLLDNCPNPHGRNGGRRSSCRSCQRLSLMYTPQLQRLSQLSRLSSLAYCKSPMTSPRPDNWFTRPKARRDLQKKRERTEQVMGQSAASSPRSLTHTHVTTYFMPSCWRRGHRRYRKAYRRSCLSERYLRKILSMKRYQRPAHGVTDH